MDNLPDEVLEKILLLTNYEDMITSCELTKRFYMIGKDKFIPLIISYLKENKNWHLGKITLSRLKALCNDVTYNSQSIFVPNNYYTIVKGKIIRHYNTIINDTSFKNVIKIFNISPTNYVYLKDDGTVYNIYGKVDKLENIIYILYVSEYTYWALSSNGEVFSVTHGNAQKISYASKVTNILNYYANEMCLVLENNDVVLQNGAIIIPELKYSKQILILDDGIITLKNDGIVYYFCKKNGSLLPFNLTNIKYIVKNTVCCFGIFYALSENGKLYVLSKRKPLDTDLEYREDLHFYKLTIPVSNVEKISGSYRFLHVLTKEKILYSFRNYPAHLKYKEIPLQLEGTNFHLLEYDGIIIDNNIYGIEIFTGNHVGLLPIT